MRDLANMAIGILCMARSQKNIEMIVPLSYSTEWVARCKTAAIHPPLIMFPNEIDHL